MHHIVKTHVHPGTIDCIIILGGGSKGKNLDKETKNRVKEGVNIYKNKISNKILMTGGKINNEFSEASLMGNYAIKLGVKNKDILLEEQSPDTFGNAIYSKQIIEKNKFKRLLIVTSDYHLERSLFIFHHVFGQSYTIMGFDVPTNLFKKIILQKERKERKYLFITQVFFTGIKLGDNKSILSKKVSSKIFRTRIAKINRNAVNEHLKKLKYI